MKNPDRQLFTAIEKGDVLGVQSALEWGASVEAIHQFKTPVLAAVFRNNAHILKLLMDAGASARSPSGTREPLAAAFWRGNLDLLAALLRTDNTATEVAGKLGPHLLDQQSPLPIADAARSLLMERWQPIFLSLIEQGTLQKQKGYSWWSQVPNSLPTEKTLLALQAVHPVQKSTNKEDMLSGIARGYPNIPTLSFFAGMGWLDHQGLFEIPLGTGCGIFSTVFQRNYVNLSTLRWLVKHAGTVPGGKESLKLIQARLIPHSLGARGSWPLTRLLCKTTGSNLMEESVSARDFDGKSALHLLLDTYGDYKRRLVMAEQILEAGMDPMALDHARVPACYGSVFFRKYAPQALALMGRFGADFSPGGPVAAALEKEHIRHQKWQTEATREMCEFYIAQSRERLDQDTQAATQSSGARRI